MSNRSLALLLACSSALLTHAPAGAAVTEPAPPLVADRAWTRIHFDRETLTGFELEVAPNVDVIEFEAVPPSALVVDAAGPDFEGITGGALHHATGFAIRSRGEIVRLDALTVVPGAHRLALSLRDASGRELLTVDNIHFYYEPDARRVRLANADVLVSRQLAALLGRPDLAGLAIGWLELDSSTQAEASGSTATRGSCTPIWEGDVDVDLAELSSVQQVGVAGTTVSARMSTKLRNVGQSDVIWYQKYRGALQPYETPYATDQHPYLVWAMYRIAPLGEAEAAPTTITMLGQSALKHAFFATNQNESQTANCGCPGAQILWSAQAHGTSICADVYGTTNNDDARAIGPRAELEAHSGLWTSTGSPWFDADANGVCDWDSPSGGDSNGNDCDNGQPNTPSPMRLTVQASDLGVAGANYLFDSWYIVRDDVDIFNTMGWKPIAPSFNGSSWSFPFTPTNVVLAHGSILDAWVPRAAPPAGSSHERVDTGVGHLSLAAKSTDLTGGQFHYEYALVNHDFDRKVQSFRVPFPAGTTISNAAFRGLGNGGGADWTISISADAVAFQAPADVNVNVNALEWGTLFSFGFDADVSPAAGTTDLGALEETPSLLFAAPAVTPGGAKGNAIFFDDFESGGSTRWSSTVG